VDRSAARGSTENADGHPNGNDNIRPTRTRRASSHLEDYVCYAAQVNDPSLVASPPKGSSGNPYPLVNYITCNNFSNSHRAFLDSITKIIEPRYYYEAIKDPRWRKAMGEEIRALEENKTWTVEGREETYQLQVGLQNQIQIRWDY